MPSGSSARGKPRPPRKRSTPKISVRYVEFTPEEMAYELPEETSDWLPIPGRGWKAAKRFIAWKRQMARLDPDVRRAFPDDRAVNAALRKVVEIQKLMPARRSRQTV